MTHICAQRLGWNSRRMTLRDRLPFPLLDPADAPHQAFCALNDLRGFVVVGIQQWASGQETKILFHHLLWAIMLYGQIILLLLGILRRVLLKENAYMLKHRVTIMLAAVSILSFIPLVFLK